MSIGAEQAAQAEPESFVTDQQQDWLGAAIEESPPPTVAPGSESAGVPIGVRVFGVLLILLAIAWTGLFGWSLWQSRPALAPVPIASAIAAYCAPLALLALLWVWLGRAPRR